MSDPKFIALVVSITIIIVVVLFSVLCILDDFLPLFLSKNYFADLERIEQRLIYVEDSVDRIEEHVCVKDCSGNSACP